jgi:large subunit ribosomal protein L12
MLIHKAGGELNEANVKKVLEAAGVKVDDARVKALCAALDGVNIEEAVQKAAVAPVAAAAPAAEAAEGGAKAKVEEKSPEDEKKSEEEAAAGLGALFG